jgi:hypothetical protein
MTLSSPDKGSNPAILYTPTTGNNPARQFPANMTRTPMKDLDPRTETLLTSECRGIEGNIRIDGTCRGFGLYSKREIRERYLGGSSSRSVLQSA